MKSSTNAILFFVMIFFLSACGAKCPPERISYAHDLSLFPPPGIANEFKPTAMEIKGKQIQVDRVVTGPVCNETWEGTIYLTCDIVLPAWKEEAFFFQECDFDVAEDAIVYVEAHNDKRYNKGCSCHE